MRLVMSVLLLCLLTGCDDPKPEKTFAGKGPGFDPIHFFDGKVKSWGVLENRSGQPTSIVLTECDGHAEGADALRMTQRLTIGDDAPVTREWRMRRTGPATYEATANDMVGTAVGEAAGNAFHWQWTLALSPGNPLKNVTMDQWWYLQQDGSLLNRTTIRKWGFIAAEVVEHFVPQK